METLEGILMFLILKIGYKLIFWSCNVLTNHSSVTQVCPAWMCLNSFVYFWFNTKQKFCFFICSWWFMMWALKPLMSCSLNRHFSSWFYQELSVLWGRVGVKSLPFLNAQSLLLRTRPQLITEFKKSKWICAPWVAHPYTNNKELWNWECRGST